MVQAPRLLATKLRGCDVFRLHGLEDFFDVVGARAVLAREGLGFWRALTS